MKIKATHIFEIILSFFAVLVGYPYGGQMFILLMAPFVLFMVLKNDANYLPALIIHCASKTSISFFVLFAIILNSCINYKKSTAQNGKLKILFWILLAVLPLFVVLVYQRMMIDGDPLFVAISYGCYYLSFWAFFYGITVSSTFDEVSVRNLLVCLILLFVCSRLSASVSFYSSSFIVFILCSLSFLLILNTRHIFGGVVLFCVSVFVFLANGMTFTELGTLLMTMLFTLLCSKHKLKTVRFISGGWVFVIFVLLIFFGAYNYMSYSVNDVIGQISIEDMGTIGDKFKYKFLSDRAPFWMAAIEQLITIKPWLPMHDIPGLMAMSINGNNLDASSFGAHNSFLQCLRIFGFIMGTVLIYCYIKMTCLARNVFNNIGRNYLPLFSASIASTLILCLTGTASMLPEYCLLTFGIMGIAYEKSLYN